jgi:hypothetical protein
MMNAKQAFEFLDAAMDARIEFSVFGRANRKTGGLKMHRDFSAGIEIVCIDMGSSHKYPRRTFVCDVDDFEAAAHAALDQANNWLPEIHR